MNRSRFSVLLILSIFIGGLTIIYAQAPYSINVDPENAVANPGDPITYKVGVTAEPEFNDPIDIELQVTVLTFQENYTLGTTTGPYPITEEFTITVPEDVPSGITATGLIIATSGEYRLEKEVTIETPGQGIAEKIIEYVNDVIDEIIQFLRDLF